LPDDTVEEIQSRIAFEGEAVSR
jgi:hypothetical protein